MTPSPSMPAPLDPHAGWIALGLTGACAAALLPSLLTQGGLAPALVAVAIAALGLPAALREPPPGTPWEQAMSGWLWLGIAAATVAGVSDSAGAVTWLLAPLGWALAGRLARGSSRSIASTIGVLALGGLTLPALAWLPAAADPATHIGPPWALLQPTWTTWTTWLPGAALLGLLLPASGLGLWRATSQSAHTTAPAARALALGCALLAGLSGVLGVAHGSLPVASLPGADWYALPLALAACVASTSAASRTLSTASPPGQPHTLGPSLGLTAWFLLGGADARAWWWQTWLPAGIAALALAKAQRHPPARPLLAAIALVALLALWFDGAPVPEAPRDAALAAGTAALFAWGVGLHALWLERR